jgi:hypothetical protein
VGGAVDAGMADGDMLGALRSLGTPLSPHLAPLSPLTPLGGVSGGGLAKPPPPGAAAPLGAVIAGALDPLGSALRFAPGALATLPAVRAATSGGDDDAGEKGDGDGARAAPPLAAAPASEAKRFDMTDAGAKEVCVSRGCMARQRRNRSGCLADDRLSRASSRRLGIVSERRVVVTTGHVGSASFLCTHTRAITSPRTGRT